MVNQLRNVLIGGGTGFIGTALRKCLAEANYSVAIVSRKPGPISINWTELSNKGLPDNCVAVVNLAGQNVLDPTRRWTPGFKQNVWASRVNTTRSLAEVIKKAKHPPKVFITISGVGYYKASDTAEYTEESPGGTHDFLAQLAAEWEAAGELPKELGVRRVIIRSGVVLGRQGGLIQQMFWPFYLGVGGPVASGKQYMPWIHVHDLARLFRFCIENDHVTGVLNGVAPHVATNAKFAKTFARVLWRPALFPLPQFALDLAFGKERASMMTEGQKVLPKRTQELGFKYDYPDLESACRECAKVFYAYDE